MTFVFFTMTFIPYFFITACSLFINSYSPFCELATTVLSSAYLIMLTVFSLTLNQTSQTIVSSKMINNNEESEQPCLTCSSDTTLFWQCLTNRHKSLLVKVHSCLSSLLQYLPKLSLTGPN